MTGSPSPTAGADASKAVQDLRDLVALIETGAARTGAPAWVATAELGDAVRRLGVEELIALVDSLKRFDGEPRSIALYRMWLGQFEDGAPKTFAAWYNLGVQLMAAGETAAAAAAFHKARMAKADLYQASVNLGLAYETLGRHDLALRAWREALQPDEARVALLNHRARLLESLKRYEEANAAIEASLLTNPRQPDALHHWIGLRAKTCSWPVFEGNRFGLSDADMREAAGSLTLLALFDDIDLQSRLNRDYIDSAFPRRATRLSPAEGYRHDRLRIGYLSSDFCMHPITYLVTELFESHDRERFTIHGYCSTKDDGSKERARVIAAFDRFTSIAALSDEAAARAIAADEIDILVDLNGLTLGNRLQILRWRPAPVQVTYLGYNGPMPMDELDYILADPFVIPPDVAARYSPRPLMLPTCFQANDGKLAVASPGTRAEAGLPEDMFVFCCFSNTYKITEEMFEAWLQILGRAPRSVLWLYADNAMARTNLEARAAARGIGQDRLIFAPRAEPATYRGRLALADLFLDTYPYNAGTTASDALRVGLPIVTLCGESFIARMAGSLLDAIGLGEGIVTTRDAYVERAVALATDAALHGAVRRKASPEAWARTLGNTPAFTRDIEAIYQSIARRGDAPAGTV